MKWGQAELLYWLPLALPLAWLLFALLRRRRGKEGRPLPVVNEIDKDPVPQVRGFDPNEEMSRH